MSSESVYKPKIRTFFSRQCTHAAADRLLRVGIVLHEVRKLLFRGLLHLRGPTDMSFDDVSYSMNFVALFIRRQHETSMDIVTMLGHSRPPRSSGGISYRVYIKVFKKNSIRN